MMKKNRPTMLSALLIIAMALFTFSAVYAQEEVKEEIKMITIKMTTDDDGNVTVDTTIVLDGDLDGDWEKLITDEDMLEKLEELDIDIDIESDGNVYIMKTSPHTTKSSYFYETSTDDEDIDTHIEVMYVGEEIIVDIVDGDTVITVKVSPEIHQKQGNKELMVWHSNGDDDGHDAMFVTSTIMVSDISEEDLTVLADANIKVGKEQLHLHNLEISTISNGNLKIEFHANELKNLSVSLHTAWGKQIYLEELKTLDGKYIREIEIPGEQDGDFYLHIKSGKKSLIKKIKLD